MGLVSLVMIATCGRIPNIINLSDAHEVGPRKREVTENEAASAEDDVHKADVAVRRLVVSAGKLDGGIVRDVRVGALTA